MFGLLIAGNPMLTGEPVGGAFFNLILLGYGFPAVLAIVLALTTRDTRPMPYRWLAAATAIVLSLAYLTLQVRTLYPRAGADVRRAPPTPSSTPIRRSGSPSAWCCCSPASGCARSRRGLRRRWSPR